MKQNNISIRIAKITIALILSSVSVTEAALVSRMGGQVVYDTDLNISWLANANLAVTEPFGLEVAIGQIGTMKWLTANDWIARLNQANYLGFTDWRLPTGFNQDGSGPLSGFNCTSSDICHLFYSELGGIEGSSITLSTDPALDLFQNIQSRRYWTSTEGLLISTAWSFGFDDGIQDTIDKGKNLNVWAVRSGDIGVVPLPSSAWLFLGGLSMLVGYSRKRTQ